MPRLNSVSLLTFSPVLFIFSHKNFSVFLIIIGLFSIEFPVFINLHFKIAIFYSLLVARSLTCLLITASKYTEH